MISKKIENLNG